MNIIFDYYDRNRVIPIRSKSFYRGGESLDKILVIGQIEDHLYNSREKDDEIKYSEGVKVIIEHIYNEKKTIITESYGHLNRWSTRTSEMTPR